MKDSFLFSSLGGFFATVITLAIYSYSPIVSRILRYFDGCIEKTMDLKDTGNYCTLPYFHQLTHIKWKFVTNLLVRRPSAPRGTGSNTDIPPYVTFSAYVAVYTCNPGVLSYALHVTFWPHQWKAAFRLPLEASIRHLQKWHHLVSILTTYNAL